MKHNQRPDAHCYYCGVGVFKRVSQYSKKYPKLTFDHVISLHRVSKKQGQSPLVKCCLECNVDKGSLTIEEYRVVLAFRNGWIQDAHHQFYGEQLNWKTE